MPEQILPELFRIEIPLPDNPLRYVNSYVLRSPEKNLVIDTGLNRDECYQAMTAGLAELDIDLARTYFFITHLHADHFGLVSRLVTEPKHIYFSRPETEIIESWSGWEPMIIYAAQNGFPEDLLREALHSHPGFKYSSSWVPDMNILEDGDVIEIGEYRLVCVETPGHTSGHICLYEREKKILFSGDHILGDISPNIQCWSDREDPLRAYLSSLDKVARLEVDLVLPGHRTVIRDMLGRIDELKTHHHRRCGEILDLLRQTPMDAFTTASRMTWDLSGKWEAFPLAQKWFATAEATAHLRYLEERQDIERHMVNGTITYAPTRSH
jgi:glyoxylase-like metal-dependent hydrolase (beta-lactamase superfamily II)